MKKLLTLTAAMLVAVSCNKNPQDEPIVPPPVPTQEPISFGASARVDVVESKVDKDLATTDVLSIFAFKGATLPADKTAAAAAIWNSATNVEYGWDVANSYFKEVVASGSSATLYWPASGNTDNDNKLSFASYFPHVAAGATGDAYVNTTDYVLKADFAKQDGVTVDGNTAAPNYAFAWVDAVNQTRTVANDKVQSVDLTYKYKVAKLTLAIKGDGSSVGGTDGAINVDKSVTGGGAAANGVKSIKIYGAGLMTNYELNLLNGTPAGTTVATADVPIVLYPKDVAAVTTPTTVPAHVSAVGYLVPAATADLTGGISVQIEYSDGTISQPFKGTIKADDLSLANGLQAGFNYVYTLKLGKAGITFTGKVTDWTDVSGGEDIPLE